MPGQSRKIKRLPRLRFHEEVFDLRRPDRVGRFNCWTMGGRLAVVLFPGGGREFIPAEQVRSRLAMEAGKRLVAGRQLGRLKKKAAIWDLTVEEYLDAIS